MSSMQQSISAMLHEVHSINFRVEQNQLDFQECLKYHHPSSSDDMDDAPIAEASRFLWCIFIFIFETIFWIIC
jgi:hypothetical protein